MHELELERDRFQPVSREVDEEEETEVVPQLRIDRLVVQEVSEVIGTWRSRPWNTCAEWPAISVAPSSSRVRAAARTCATGSATMFGPQCGVTSVASASSPRVAFVNQSGVSRRE